MIGDLILAIKRVPGNLRLFFKQMFCAHDYRYKQYWGYGMRVCKKCDRHREL